MKRFTSFFKTAALMAVGVMALFACSENDPAPDPVKPNGMRLMVLNEGNFGQGNASITGVTVRDSVVQELFRKTNANRPLGDGAQSATQIDKKLYICVNNSGKVEVVSADQLRSVATIKLEGANPMYMAQINDSLAAVTSLYNSKLYIINVTTDRLSRTIDLPNPGEQIVAVGQYLVVSTVSPWIDMTTPRTESLTVLDRNTLAIKGTVQIDNSLLFNYGKLCVDGGGKIWKLVSNKVVVFDPATQKTVQTIDLPSSITLGWNSRYDMNPNRRAIYFVDGANTVHLLSLDNAKFTKVFEMKEATAFYNIACSASSLIITDAMDYVSSGWIFEHKLDGTFVKKYKAGISPQFVFFIKP